LCRTELASIHFASYCVATGLAELCEVDEDALLADAGADALTGRIVSVGCVAAVPAVSGVAGAAAAVGDVTAPAGVAVKPSELAASPVAFISWHLRSSAWRRPSTMLLSPTLYSAFSISLNNFASTAGGVVLPPSSMSSGDVVGGPGASSFVSQSLTSEALSVLFILRGRPYP
jgi:hypothetical protein